MSRYFGSRARKESAANNKSNSKQPAPKSLSPLKDERRKNQQFGAMKVYLATVFLFWSPSFLQATSNALFPPPIIMHIHPSLPATDQEPVGVSTSSTLEESAAVIIPSNETHTSQQATGTLSNHGEEEDQRETKSVAGPSSSDEFIFSRYTNNHDIPPHGNVLLFLTSHLTEAHIKFLENCWPMLLQQSPLLKHAHVLVYANPPAYTKLAYKNRAMNIIQNTFSNNPSLRIFLTETAVAQEYGRLDSMWQASKREWWLGGSQFATENGDASGYAYDWVLRLHPDVVIRNDTFLVESMQDPRVEGIFTDCHDIKCPKNQRCLDRRIHTDITLFRPGSLVQKRAFFVAKKRQDRAVPEEVAWRTFQGVINRGADRWIPDTGIHQSTCRVGHRSFAMARLLKKNSNITQPHLSPVIHTHAMVPSSLEECASAFSLTPPTATS
jgi:hypothetical protein